MDVSWVFLPNKNTFKRVDTGVYLQEKLNCTCVKVLSDILNVCKYGSNVSKLEVKRMLKGFRVEMSDSDGKRVYSLAKGF